MSMKYIAHLSLFLFMLCGGLPPGKPVIADERKQLFNLAIEEHDKGNLERARELYLEILKGADKNTEIAGVLWNLGSISIILEDYKRAEQAWLLMRKIEPENWEVLTKLCQTYRGLGDNEKFEKTKTELLSIHASGRFPELAKRRKFLAEQRPRGQGRIYVYYHFDHELIHPENEWMSPIIYEALYTQSNSGGNALARALYGAFNYTNAIYRDSADYKDAHKLFHFDYYDLRDNSHQLIGMQAAETPRSFEEVSPILMQIISDNHKEN